MLHTTSYDWLSRLAAIVDRSSFTEAVLLSLFLKTPGPLSRPLKIPLAKSGGWSIFSVFPLDLSAAFDG